MRGRLAEMYFWSRALDAREVAVIAQGFDQTLRCVVPAPPECFALHLVSVQP
jgi:hypothetical protein